MATTSPGRVVASSERWTASVAPLVMTTSSSEMAMPQWSARWAIMRRSSGRPGGIW